MKVEDVNSAWRVLFTQGGRSLENIPSTLATLKEQILYAFLQSVSGLSTYRKTEQVTIQVNGVGRKLKTCFFQFGVNYMHQLLS